MLARERERIVTRAEIEDRRLIAWRLFDALSVQYPNKYVTLVLPRNEADGRDRYPQTLEQEGRARRLMCYKKASPQSAQDERDHRGSRRSATNKVSLVSPDTPIPHVNCERPITAPKGSAGEMLRREFRPIRSHPGGCGEQRGMQSGSGVELGRGNRATGVSGGTAYLTCQS
jgi:hypothetical protein